MSKLEVQRAWDPPSGDESLDPPCSEDAEDRRLFVQGLFQVSFAASALALGLFASHVESTEHALFYVCDALLVLVFAGYSVLRWAGRLGRESMAPACMLFAWALSLLLSLSAPSRRRRLLGLEDGDGPEPCEEGSAALWIALLLCLLPVLSPIPVVPFALLGQLVSLQYLVIGLLLPRQECSSDAGGPGGVTLGLPPIWVSALQLSALAALLVAGCWHLERRRNAEKLIDQFLHTRLYGRTSVVSYFSGYGGAGQMAQNRLERIVNMLEKEEKDCRQLLRELDDILVSVPGEHVWASLALHLASMLEHCSSELKHITGDGDNATDHLFHAMESGSKKHDPTQAAAVSGWLEQGWTPTGGRQRARRSSIARSEQMDMAMATLESTDLLPLQRVEEEEKRWSVSENPVLSSDWRIGEWDFDALKCDLENSHVLQTVGFQLLRSYSILPRAQLCIFLDRLEQTYSAGSPYHSHIHGADMTNAFFYLVTKTNLWHLADFANSTRVATIIAALGHDAGHFAHNNVFLISSRHALAMTYNDRSVLENFHASTVVRLLSEEYGEPSDRKALFSGFSDDHQKKARTLMISLILGTDPQKHLEELSAFRMRMGASSFDPASDDNDQQMCLGMMFRAADIGHSAKEWTLHQEWSRRVVEEFHAQGDEEKRRGLQVSPLCERENFQLASSQIGFLQFICLPTWSELANLEGKIQEVSNMFDMLRANRKSSRSSIGSGLRCASPKGSGNSERRGSIGHTLHMLTGASKSRFLVLPGSVPGTPTAKVAPADASHPAQEEPPSTPTRWVRDVCLAHCEQNCQAWKDMAKSTNAASSATETAERAERISTASTEPLAQAEVTVTPASAAPSAVSA
mmetsp:Transcript_34547/g.99139  ORF Transcript_34547/g.99139 Transcript_34547/m.99139 type:complete len:860 (+) Transcript_34547:184-2763(+)